MVDLLELRAHRRHIAKLSVSHSPGGIERHALRGEFRNSRVKVKAQFGVHVIFRTPRANAKEKLPFARNAPPE